MLVWNRSLSFASHPEATLSDGMGLALTGQFMP